MSDQHQDHHSRVAEAIEDLRLALAEQAAALAADERRLDGDLHDYLDRTRPIAVASA